MSETCPCGEDHESAPAAAISASMVANMDGLAILLGEDPKAWRAAASVFMILGACESSTEDVFERLTEERPETEAALTAMSTFYAMVVELHKLFLGHPVGKMAAVDAGMYAESILKKVMEDDGTAEGGI